LICSIRKVKEGVLDEEKGLLEKRLKADSQTCAKKASGERLREFGRPK